MSSLTDFTHTMSEISSHGKLSVVETLEQAKQALQTHRAWMKRRKLVSPALDSTFETREHQVDMGIFTHDKIYPPTREDVSSSEKERRIAIVSAPPPFLEQSTGGRDNKVSPASLSNLPNLPVGRGSLTGAPSFFYGTPAVSETIRDLARKSSPSGGDTKPTDKKMIEPSVQRRQNGSARNCVVPVSQLSNGKAGDYPNSLTGVFYGDSQESDTPPLTAQDSWTDTQSPPKLSTELSQETKSCSYSQNMQLEPHTSTYSTTPDASSLSEDIKHNPSTDIGIFGSHAVALNGDEGALIVPVSPAPKEQQSSYSSHTQSKIKTVEESLEIISEEGKVIMATPLMESTPAVRLPATSHSAIPRKLEPLEVSDTFMQKVLPKSLMETLEAETMGNGTVTISEQSQSQFPDAGHQSESDVLQDGLEDIETVDLFSSSSLAHKKNSGLVITIGDQKTNIRTDLPTPSVNKEGPTLTAGGDSVENIIKESDFIETEGKACKKGSTVSQPPLLEQNSPSSPAGISDTLRGEKESDNRELKELKLPPLREVSSVTSLDGNKMVEKLPALKSPLTPYTTGFTFSSKRERAPPHYSIHQRRGSMGLAPPCPRYGVSQPKELTELLLFDPPTHYTDLSLLTQSLASSSLANNAPIITNDHAPLSADDTTPSLPVDHTPSSSGDHTPSTSTVVIEATTTTSSPSGTMVPAVNGGSNLSIAALPAGPGPLHLAAKSGNLRRLQALVNIGHDVDMPDQNGQTPLMYCIHSAGVHLSCADALIREGANVNKQSSDGSTAMHLASSVGGVALIELMILNGARTDVRDFEGRLPIHWATLQRSTKVLAILLEHTGSCVDVTDDTGMTPLMWAAYNNNARVTSFLLERGADLEEKDNDGYTAMHWGVHREGTQCLQLILKADMTYFKDHKGKTVILFAAEKGSMAACELILKMRPDAIHDTDKMGRTPLHYAAACSRVDVCALLLDRGADASQRDSTGRTALDYARLKRMDYVVALLTCHGTAVADFARASRSTSIESLLNRTISFGQLSGKATESMASLVSQPKSNLNKSLDSLVSSHTTMADRSGTPASVVGVSGEGVDVSKGGYLGRFVNDKTDPIKHFFFRLHPDLGTISWTKERGESQRTSATEMYTVLEVHEGPSNSVRQSTCYSPEELHRHVFWLLTAGGILDLLAYNQEDYSIWLHEARQVAATNQKQGDIGQGLRRQQRIMDSCVPCEMSTSRGRVAPIRTRLLTEGSGDVSRTSEIMLESSKLFLADNSNLVPAKNPVRDNKSGHISKSKVGVAPESHVTDYRISKGSRSDIFMTSTPRATTNGLKINDVII